MYGDQRKEHGVDYKIIKGLFTQCTCKNVELCDHHLTAGKIALEQMSLIKVSWEFQAASSPPILIC